MFDVYVELEAGAYTQGEIKQGGIFASLNPNRTTHRPSVHTYALHSPFVVSASAPLRLKACAATCLLLFLSRCVPA